MLRYSCNPVITRDMIAGSSPEWRDVSSVFNPGATVFNGRILLLLRVQNRGRRTALFRGVSDDGYNFVVDDHPIPILGLESAPQPILHLYDPRISAVNGRYYVVCAADTPAGCFLALLVTDDFITLTFKGFISEPDVRNGVILAQKFDDYYLMLQRPNRVQLVNGPKTGSCIWMVKSQDLLNWQPVAPVMQGNPCYWDELIGSGPPPLKTRAGWLHIYHGVATHFGSSNIYQAGVSLLDLQQPQKVIARGSQNILEPREMYELCGQVPNVVFPCGLICRTFDEDGFAPPEAEVLAYYGAADTCVGVATTTVAELLQQCRE